MHVASDIDQNNINEDNRKADLQPHSNAEYSPCYNELIKVQSLDYNYDYDYDNDKDDAVTWL